MVAFPVTTYTPGGAAESFTVTIPATGGFELSARVQSERCKRGVSLPIARSTSTPAALSSMRRAQ
jgi:hypothetical protein